MKPNTESPARNVRQVMDGLALLRALPAKCTPLMIFDPQYRQVLDKMNFGNEGRGKQTRRFELPQMSDVTIRRFVEQAERIVRPSGHLMIWMDKFALGSGHWRRWLPDATALTVVETIVWDKANFGMGARARRRFEVAQILQAPPKRADGVWRDRTITDCWTEQADFTVHPHAKPLQLTQRLIRCVTKRGDLVVDPAAGSYSTLTCCQATGREFVGCDLINVEE